MIIFNTPQTITRTIILFILISISSIAAGDNPDQEWDTKKEPILISKLEDAIAAENDADEIEILTIKILKAIEAEDSNLLFDEIINAPNSAIDISIINELLKIYEFNFIFKIYKSEIIHKKFNALSYALIIDAATKRFNDFKLSLNLFQETIDRRLVSSATFEAFISASLNAKEIETARLTIDAAERNRLTTPPAYENFIAVMSDRGDIKLSLKYCLKAVNKFPLYKINFYNPIFNALLIKNDIEESLRVFLKSKLHRVILPLPDETYNFKDLSFGATYAACCLLMNQSERDIFTITINDEDALRGLELFVNATEGSVRLLNGKTSNEKILIKKRGYILDTVLQSRIELNPRERTTSNQCDLDLLQRYLEKASRVIQADLSSPKKNLKGSESSSKTIVKVIENPFRPRLNDSTFIDVPILGGQFDEQYFIPVMPTLPPFSFCDKPLTYWVPGGI